MDKIQRGVLLILVCFQINTKAELTGKLSPKALHAALITDKYIISELSVLYIQEVVSHFML